MYYSDLEDIEEIGWDRFICGAWEAIFVELPVDIEDQIDRAPVE